MNIDWNRTSLRLAANPLAVARHVESLPPVALCILRLLDGQKTVQDALDLSPVDEPTARAILQRLTELGLAAPVPEGSVQASLARYASLSAPLKTWMTTPSSRPSPKALDRQPPTRAPKPAAMDEVDALFAELDQSLPEPQGAKPPPLPASLTRGPRLEASKPSPPSKILAAFPPAARLGGRSSTLESALRCHLGEAPQETTQEAPAWTEQEQAFFDSWAPEEPMTDTFSDLLSRPRRR